MEPTHLYRRGDLEAYLRSQGYTPIGLDEVGRGCLAGPVYAGATVMDYDAFFRAPSASQDLVRDSKTLSSKQRDVLVPMLEKSWTRAHHVASASVTEIENLGIVGAIFLAMERCYKSILDQLPSQASAFVLVDGRVPVPFVPKAMQSAVVRGDSTCFAIAAASILAKEARDKHMHGAAVSYPGYGFSTHVGYGTVRHRAALERLGPCPMHRGNFSPIKELRPLLPSD